jgi:hypothetical protein
LLQHLFPHVPVLKAHKALKALLAQQDLPDRKALPVIRL